MAKDSSVAEIWCREVRHYAQFSGYLYGKLWKKWRKNWIFFIFFWIFRDFSTENSEKSRNWDFSVGKNPKNLKISKICFLQIFCFCFAYNLAKNGQNWVIWWKVIRFFRWKKINFFIIFSIIFHTNTPKTARSTQLRDIVSRHRTNLFSFCKKDKSRYNPNFKIC